MHDRDELHSEPSLHITGDVFHSGGDGILGSEGRVYDYAKTFHLEVGLVQGFEGTAVVEVVIKWDGKMRVRDGGYEGGVFGGGRERAESVAVDGSVDREDRGNFYSR